MKWTGYIGLLLVGILLGGWMHHKYQFRGATEMVQRDTLVFHDTIRVDSPVEVRYKVLTETIRIPVRDTIRITDTLYLVTSRESREYKDSTYRAVVSGYDPRLDYIEVYPKTTIVKETKTISAKKKMHEIIFSAGIGRSSEFTIPIGVGYMYHPVSWLGVGARVEYDLRQKVASVQASVEIPISW